MTAHKLPLTARLLRWVSPHREFVSSVPGNLSPSPCKSPPADPNSFHPAFIPHPDAPPWQLLVHASVTLYD